MMLAALFPDAVEFRRVTWDEVSVPVWSVEEIGKAIRDGGSFSKPIEFDTEHTKLQPITFERDVLAGMSEKTHIVFYCLVGE